VLLWGGAVLFAAPSFLILETRHTSGTSGTAELWLRRASNFSLNPISTGPQCCGALLQPVSLAALRQVISVRYRTRYNFSFHLGFLSQAQALMTQ
jgi:hypothetical protein